MDNLRVLVPSGVLGLGFDLDALKNGLRRNPNIICIDGGSTDSGPHSLGSSTSKYSRSAIKSEWKTLMKAREEIKVPLLIGSSGTSGTDEMVDWMEQITTELAKEMGHSLKIAKLYCEQDKNFIKESFLKQKIYPLDPHPRLDVDVIQDMSHIVALAGAEQIQACIQTGADIIIAGRTTDTAIISALPLMKGANPGGSWHGAKIAECGALCSNNPTSGVVLIEFDETGFTVEAMASNASCTPESVAAHMLYENADPFILYEPGGYMDVKNANYKQEDNGKVRVDGAKWYNADNYNVKLEGAKITGYQTSLLALLREKNYVDNKSNSSSFGSFFFCSCLLASSSLIFSKSLGKNIFSMETSIFLNIINSIVNVKFMLFISINLPNEPFLPANVILPSPAAIIGVPLFAAKSTPLCILL